MNKQKIFAILPAYNAKKTFKHVVDSLPNGVFEAIILSDDGSRDGTYEAAKQDKRLVVIKTPKNLGYGGNLKFCLSHALGLGADAIVEIHPDGEYQTDGILPALTKVNNGAHLILGNRFLGLNNGMNIWKNIGTRGLSAIDRVWLGMSIGDLHQGFRVYTRQLLENNPYKTYSNNYLFSFEIIVDAIRNGFTVEEVPVSTSYTGKKRGALPKAAILYTLQTFLVLIKITRKEFTGNKTLVMCDICLTDHTTYKLDSFIGKHDLYRCYGCGCAFTTPRNIDLSKHYLDRYYDLGMVSQIKQWVYGIFQRRRIEWLKKYVKTGSTVVDVGAGNGSFGRSLGNTFTTVSLEASFAAIDAPDVLRTNILKYSVKKPVDAVTLWESLEHMEEPDKVLQRASTWLSSGGYIMIEYPRFNSLESRLFGKYWYHLDIPRHRTHFTDSGIRGLLEAHGFAMVKQHPVWALEYAIVGFAASILHWSPTIVSQNSSHPLTFCMLLVVLSVTCPIEILLGILGQSPIGVVVARKKA